MLYEGDIIIVDEATPFLEQMAKSKPEWMRKVMKSTGWWIQKEIKAGIRCGAPAGKAYASFMPSGIRRKLEVAFGNKGKRVYSPLGGMVNAVGYEYRKSEETVVIGWLSNSAVRLGEKIEAGDSKMVTEKMRHYFFAAGVPLSPGKSTIVIPPRKTFDPMRNMLQPKVADYMENKLLEYMQNGGPASSTNRRRYRVRG